MGIWLCGLKKCLKATVMFKRVTVLTYKPAQCHLGNLSIKVKYGRSECLIRSQLQKVFEIIPVPKNHLKKLIPLATQFQNLTLFLKSCNVIQNLCNSTLMEEIVNKLPMTKRCLTRYRFINFLNGNILMYG